MTRIAILEPGREAAGKYFSLRLKKDITEEYPVYNTPSKMLVISGFHGKFKALQHALIRYGVINEKGRWIYDNGHLVIFGGPADFTAAALACQWYLYALEERALKKGGRVHYIASMEEIAGLNLCWSFTQPLYAGTFQNNRRPHAVLYDGNNELKRWLLTKNIIEKIGPLLFVNGLIPQTLLQATPPLTWLNKKLREYYAAPGFSAPSGEDVFRGLSARYQAECVVTAATEVGPVVVQPSHVNVWSAMDEEAAETLFITHNHYYRLHTNGEKERLK